MPLPKPEPGLVIRYSYLWLNEFLAGREEGVKDRPCAIIVAIQEEPDKEQRILVLPVTHRKPSRPEWAIEIPPAIKRHLGLDGEQSWIILNESNEFTWPGPDLRIVPGGDENSVAYGFLPPNFFAKIQAAFMALVQKNSAQHVKRTE
jgi:hypothetical protein